MCGGCSDFRFIYKARKKERGPIPPNDKEPVGGTSKGLGEKKKRMEQNGKKGKKEPVNLGQNSFTTLVRCMGAPSKRTQKILARTRFKDPPSSEFSTGPKRQRGSRGFGGRRRRKKGGGPLVDGTLHVETTVPRWKKGTEKNLGAD